MLLPCHLGVSSKCIAFLVTTAMKLNRVVIIENMEAILSVNSAVVSIIQGILLLSAVFALINFDYRNFALAVSGSVKTVLLTTN